MQRKTLFALLFLTLLLLSYSDTAEVSARQGETPTPAPPSAMIHAPSPGQAVQGKVAIQGSTNLEGFQTAELFFAYAEESPETWFSIASSDQPVADGLLAEWDTTTITDGLYRLRLVLTLSDGTDQTILVENLRVRNYTPAETNTPSPTLPIIASSPGPTATSTPGPSLTPILQLSTPLPPNPAEISRLEIAASLGKGALAAFGLFALLGIYQQVRSLRDRRRR